MNIYGCKLNVAYVGGTAVVIATSKEEAIDMLLEELSNQNIPIDPSLHGTDVYMIPAKYGTVEILSDGEY